MGGGGVNLYVCVVVRAVSARLSGKFEKFHADFTRFGNVARAKSADDEKWKKQQKKSWGKKQSKKERNGSPPVALPALTCIGPVERSLHFVRAAVSCVAENFVFPPLDAKIFSSFRAPGGISGKNEGSYEYEFDCSSRLPVTCDKLQKLRKIVESGKLCSRRP